MARKKTDAIKSETIQIKLHEQKPIGPLRVRFLKLVAERPLFVVELEVEREGQTPFQFLLGNQDGHSVTIGKNFNPSRTEYPVSGAPVGPLDYEIYLQSITIENGQYQLQLKYGPPEY